MQSVTEKIQEMEKCHCTKSRCSDERVCFMDMKPPEFHYNSKYGVIPKEELHILTGKRRSPISGVSEPEWHEIEITVGSGACDTIMPIKFRFHISKITTAQARSGFEYEVATAMVYLPWESDDVLR